MVADRACCGTSQIVVPASPGAHCACRGSGTGPVHPETKGSRGRTWAATGLQKADSLEVKLGALLAERRPAE